MQEAEKQWRLQSDARLSEVRLQYAEKDMQRQGELKAAILELQALTHRSQAVQSESSANMFGTFPAALASASAQGLQGWSGQQPWKVRGRTP